MQKRRWIRVITIALSVLLIAGSVFGYSLRMTVKPSEGIVSIGLHRVYAHPAPPTIASSTKITEAAATTFLVNNPSGMATGELFLAIIAKDDDISMGSDDGMTHVVDIAGVDHSTHIFWKIALAADISRGTMSFTGDSEDYVGRMYRITGFDSGTPIDAVDVTGATGTSAAPQAPTLETITNDALVFAVTGMDDNDVPYAVTTGTYTEDLNTSVATAGIVIARRVMATAGFTGVCDFTTSASDGWAATQIAIRPAAGATPAITVSPTFYDFGVVAESTTPYTSTSYFTIDNTSGMQTDQTIGVTSSSWSGGVTWTHSDTATPGANQAGLLANKEGTWGVGDVIVKYDTPNYIAENQPADTDYSFGLKLIAPTSFGDGVEKAIVVRVSAAAG